MALVTDPTDPRLTHGVDEEPRPQAEAYLVMDTSKTEFVRPVRHAYVHVGPSGPSHPLRDLTPEEHERYDRFGYIKYEPYLPDPARYMEDGSPCWCVSNDDPHEGWVHAPVCIANGDATLGTFWTQARLDAATKPGCGVVTTMGDALARTYAAEPTFYGATYCVGCQKHLPVGEFEWDPHGEVIPEDQRRVGT
jgi:hypothetical protein